MLIPEIKRKVEKTVNLKKVHLPNHSNGLLNKLKNMLFVRNLKDEIVHLSGEVYYAILFHPRTILTIHDIALAKSGPWLKRKIIGYLWYKLPAKRAKKITVISECSKKEFIEYTGVDSEKVVVIYNPIDPALELSNLPSNEKKQILIIGTKVNKNLSRMLEALKGKDIKLHIIGRLNQDQLSELKSNQINYTNDYDLTNEEVMAHYKSSDLLLFASISEGFGMPIIEAQALGRPVITSNVSSMPEIAGDAAILVDPFSIDEISRAVDHVLENEGVVKNLIEKGLENLKRFQLEKIAESYAEIYQELSKADLKR